MAIKSGRKGRHGRVVPWASWEDWLAVKDALLPKPGPTKASTEGEEANEVLAKFQLYAWRAADHRTSALGKSS